MSDLDTEPNPWAFPGHKNGRAWSGMELRDWFAGQAMAAILHDSDPHSDEEHLERFFAEMARQAFMVADAMLAARGK